MKKHDCHKTQERFTDWLLADSLIDLARIDLDGCQLCHEQFVTLKNALGHFDQALNAAMPEENYWSGYEAKFWTKLAMEESASKWQINLWQPRWMVPVAGCALLILLAVLNQGGIKKDVKPASDEVVNLNQQPTTDVQKVSDSARSGQKKRRFEKPNKPERKEAVRPLYKKPQFLFDPNPLQAQMNSEAFIAPETAVATRHFERAQMLLRAFRNSRPTEQASYDLSYEKTRSRHLLYENILIRREAEARGDWSMEEVLNNLEPLLLDIANLPETATADDVDPIKERMQKQEIVAKLQFYAMPLMAAVAD